MAGENLARLVRVRAIRITRRYAAERIRAGDDEGAAMFTELADEIGAIPAGEGNDG